MLSTSYKTKGSMGSFNNPVMHAGNSANMLTMFLICTFIHFIPLNLKDVLIANHEFFFFLFKIENN